jgi:hypothetical protein
MLAEWFFNSRSFRFTVSQTGTPHFWQGESHWQKSRRKFQRYESRNADILLAFRSTPWLSNKSNKSGSFVPEGPISISATVALCKVRRSC